MLNYLLCKCTCLGGGPTREISANVDILNLDILNAEPNAITIDLKLKFMLNYTTLNRGDILYVQKDQEFSIKENKIKSHMLASDRIICLDQLESGYSGVIESTICLAPDVYVLLFLRAVQRFDPEAGWKFLGNSQPFSLDLESETGHGSPGSLKTKTIRDSTPNSLMTVKNSCKIEKNLKTHIEKTEDETVKPRKIMFNPEESREEFMKALATTKASFNSILIPGKETVSFLDSKRNFESIFEDWSPEKPKINEQIAEPKKEESPEIIGLNHKKNVEAKNSPLQKPVYNEEIVNKENMKNQQNTTKGNNRYSNVNQNSKEKAYSGKRSSNSKHSAGPSSNRSVKAKGLNQDIEVKSFDPTYIYKETMKKYNQNKVMAFPTKPKKAGTGAEKPLADKRM